MVTVWKCCFHFKFLLKLLKYEAVSSISRHKGILNKHLCKNFFEKYRMPVFLWRFEYKRRRLNSNNETHWLQVSAYKLLEYYLSNITQAKFLGGY